MSLTVITHVVYLVCSAVLVLAVTGGLRWPGPGSRRPGGQAPAGNEGRAPTVGVALIGLGIAALLVPLGGKVRTGREFLDTLSLKLGTVALVLGIAYLINAIAYRTGERRRAEAAELLAEVDRPTRRESRPEDGPARDTP